MPVSAAHPDAVKLDEAFAAAMDTPGKPREPGPPPEVDHDAPFGRDDDGKPLAPHGYTKDGRVRRSAAGRKPAEDKARIAERDKTGDGKKGKAVDTPADAQPGRYTAGIADAVETVWLGGTVLAMVGEDLPLIGPRLPVTQIHAQAAVLLGGKDQVAGALDLCAQHNDTARKLAAWCAGGGAGWALNAAFMLMPVVSASFSVWSKDEPETDDDGNPLPTMAERLAEKNQQAFADYMERMAAQAGAADQEGPGNAGNP